MLDSGDLTLGLIPRRGHEAILLLTPSLPFPSLHLSLCSVCL